MSIVPIGHESLNRADITAIIARGKALSDPNRFGEWVTVATEDGDVVVAALSPDNESLIFGFGKEAGWYYAFDAEGECLAEGRFIEDLFTILA